MSAKAIIFDCDGVLVNSEAIYIATEMAYLERLGMTYSAAEFQTRFVGLSDTDFVEALTADFRQISTEPFPADFLDATRAECWRRFATELQPVAGLVPFLERHEGARAVASSSKPDALADKLAMTALDLHFGRHVYSSALVAAGKPAPDLFLLAAQELGHEPDACIVIEDSGNGVKAGRAAGMEVWGFTGGGHADAGLGERLDAAGAHRVFESFDAIADHWQDTGFL